MNEFWWFASGLVLGGTGGVAGMVIHAQMAADAQAERRRKQRALLGLPDRGPRRSDAIGTARVTQANYNQKDQTSGMQM